MKTERIFGITCLVLAVMMVAIAIIFKPVFYGVLLSEGVMITILGLLFIRNK